MTEKTLVTPNIWIFSLEPLESRYTSQWHSHLPKLLQSKLGGFYNVRQVDGVQKNSAVTEGAFLNFADTNYWKSSQLCNFLDLHNQGLTTPFDHFVFADAWNPTVIQLKYMSSLLNFQWKLHGLWHAGSYDPHDFLGRLIGSAKWVRSAEHSMFESFDHNYFATESHIQMFAEAFGPMAAPSVWAQFHTEEKHIVRSGWSMEYMADTLAPYANLPKRDLIVFPHRIAPEKQLGIFKSLAAQMPEYEWVVCQEQSLTKHEYHTLMGQAKIVFSANLQETLGITTCAEGPLLGAVPVAPDRLSYTEIFADHPQFLYPSKWTESELAFNTLWRDAMTYKIRDIMANYDQYTASLDSYCQTVYPKYFHADAIINQIGASIWQS